MNYTQTNNTKSYKIMSLNINSLVSIKKRAELTILLTQHNPDILLISETKTRLCHRITFRNYNIIRNDRTWGPGGGTAILYKNTLQAESLLSNLTSKSLEYTAASFKMENRKKLFVFSIYNNDPNHTHLETDLNILINLTNKSQDHFVIGGDFNARHTSWRNANNNSNGIRLKQWIDENDPILTHAYSLLPSYVGGDRRSYIDFFMISKTINICTNSQTNTQALQSCEFESDHRVIEINIDIGTRISKSIQILRKDYENANWVGFKHSCNEAIGNIIIPTNKLLSHEEIVNTIEQLTEAIQTSENSNVPSKTYNNRNNINLPISTITLIKYKNSIRKKLYQNPISPISSIRKSQIKLLNIMITNQVNYAKANELKKSLNTLKKDKNVFTKINKITNRKPFANIPNLIDSTVSPAVHLTNPFDKANLLGHYFEHVHTSCLEIGDPDNSRNININIKNEFQIDHAVQTPMIRVFNNTYKSDSFSEIPEIQEIQTFTNPCEIDSIIKQLRPKKSSGFDNISNYLIKKLPPIFSIKFAIIVNNCLNLGYFPNNWKCAKILPFLKHGKPAYQSSSYRPISLLSSMSKIFECIMQRRIEEFTIKNQIIPNFQFGFKKGHSTSHALLKFSNDIVNALKNKKYVAACSLDIEKAFDCVWIEGLIHKMKMTYNFPPFLLKILYNYLKERTFRVSIYTSNGENIYSNIYNIVAGTAQGSVLAPHLFNIFMADIPECTDLIPTGSCKTIMFADDTIIYAENSVAVYATGYLNAHLHALQQYYKKWKIKVNVAKTQGIVFRAPAGRIKIPSVDIQINRNRIEMSTTIKYLGVTFTNLFKFSKHVQLTTAKCKVALSRLRPILNPSNAVPTDIKILVYKQLLRPILTYGYPTWFNVSRGQIEQMCKLERKCLRQCINFKRTPENFKFISNKLLYDQSMVTPLPQHLITTLLNFLQKSTEHNNTYISQIFSQNNEETHSLSRYRSAHYLWLAHTRNEIFNDQNEFIFYTTTNTRYPPIS